MTAVPPAADRPGADLIRTAVLANPDVAGLSAGALGEVVTHLPGRRVPGLRLDDECVEVHVVAHYGRPLPELADLLAAQLAPLLAGRRLQVVFADILAPGESLPQADADVREPAVTGAPGPA